MKETKGNRTKIIGVRMNRLEDAKLELASQEANIAKGKYIRNKLFGYE